MFDLVFVLIVDLMYVYVQLVVIENDHPNRKTVFS